MRALRSGVSLLALPDLQPFVNFFLQVIELARLREKLACFVASERDAIGLHRVDRPDLVHLYRRKSPRPGLRWCRVSFRDMCREHAFNCHGHAARQPAQQIFEGNAERRQRCFSQQPAQQARDQHKTGNGIRLDAQRFSNNRADHRRLARCAARTMYNPDFGKRSKRRRGSGDNRDEHLLQQWWCA